MHLYNGRVSYWHDSCTRDGTGSENRDQKGGDYNEKGRNTSSEPAHVFSAVLECTDGERRRGYPQCSVRHLGVLPYEVPPIREDTLSWDRPVLNENAGNIIDFYGPCDHDPLGAEEVRVQRQMLRNELFGDTE